MEHDTLSVADLRLDGANPRHKPAQAQRDIIAALLAEGGSKLIALARDIATHGISPIDALLVVKNGSGYTVVEGNRRLAAIKLLSNPDLTAIQRYRRRFHDLGRGRPPIHEVWCAIAANRDEARHWQELRHTGSRQGAGTVGWGTEATSRFHGIRGTQADRALIFIDAVEKAFLSNGPLQANIATVRHDRLTTLGRVVSDPDARRELGVDFESGDLVTHYPTAELERGLAKLMSDLATTMTVAKVDNKDLRRKYIASIRSDLPDPSNYLSDARPLLSATPTKKQTKPKKQPGPPPPSKPFDGVQLVNLGGRVSQVLDEMRKLDLDQFPNTAGILVRVVIELAIEQLYQEKGWKRAQAFKDDIRACLHRVDSTDKEPRYAAVRAGLQDGSSLMAVQTLHEYIHNPNYNPTPTEIRQNAANYAPFLIALDGLV
jgi:hypothetical protein